MGPERELTTKKLMKRNAIKQDVLVFAIPAALFYVAGMAASARDLVRQLDELFVLAVHSVAGTALIGTGLTILLVSARTLGRSYSSSLVIREEHPLITHGIYRFTRHRHGMHVGSPLP